MPNVVLQHSGAQLDAAITVLLSGSLIGRSISTILRTDGDGTAGTIDTYTITYTDETTSTFTVVNGADAEPGADGKGVSSILRTSGNGAAGTTDTYTITYSDSTTSTFNVLNGANGSPGAAATIAVGTVTTGAAGSSAAITNAGTASAAIFNFTIPKGDAGEGSDVLYIGDDAPLDPEVNIWIDSSENVVSDILVVNDLTTGGISTALSSEMGKTLQTNKVDKETGKVLSSNDFNNTLKGKLDNVAENANNYTHPSVNHIPSNGSTGKVLVYASSGTAAWGDGGTGVDVVARNLTDNFINPDNYANLQAAIDACRVLVDPDGYTAPQYHSNKKVLVADVISLSADTSFRGVAMSVGEIKTNGFKVELGGYYAADVHAQPDTNPPQIVNTITLNPVTSASQVYIRGAVGQHITIHQCYGTININMNLIDKYNAYSTFTIGTVETISINNDTDVPAEPGAILWCNENVFFLNRCRQFYMNGSHFHGLNRIYGGTFEGASTIDIIKGKNNVFYDMRFEPPPPPNLVNIYFRTGTKNNVVHTNDNYHIHVVDEGMGNGIISIPYGDAKLLNQYSIKVDTFNVNAMNGFKNLGLTADTLGLQPTCATLGVLLETEYLKFGQNKIFVANCTVKAVRGIAVLYRIYDANFVDISETWKALSKSFYSVPTSKGANEDYSDGSYVLPNTHTANLNSTYLDMKNDHIILNPTSYWELYKPFITVDAPEIKYVKFFIIYSSYFNAGSEFYDIQAQIYDLTGNIRLHYYY